MTARSSADLPPALEISPIFQAAPEPNRAIPFGCTTVAVSGILFCLGHLSLGTLERPLPAPFSSPRYHSVSISLDEFPSSPQSEPPPANPSHAPGPDGRIDAPGVGHVLGTNSIEPDLLDLLPLIPRAPQGAIADLSSTVGLAGPQVPGIPGGKSFPIAAGGNGLPKGSGRDAGRGGRRVKSPDFKLVLIHQEEVVTDLRATDPDLLVPVRVRILVGEDGIPFSGEAIDGPSNLYMECVQTALRWRFEPLGAHGLEAPYMVVISFQPIVRSSRAKGLFPTR